jgi:hypothetical protein
MIGPIEGAYKGSTRFEVERYTFGIISFAFLDLVAFCQDGHQVSHLV